MYQNYHKHTSYSNAFTKDSTLQYEDYWNVLKGRYGNKPCVCTTVEHGYQGEYFKIYDKLEDYNKKNKTNIKFVFGCEAYWVKDRLSSDNSNCHIILLAKNDNGRKKLNKALSQANKDGYHYKARLDLDLLLSLPKDDIFVTTACIGYWNKYDDIKNITLKLNDHFTDFYLEIQAHDTTPQIKLNQYILKLSKEYNIPLIAGCDTHTITDQDIDDRDYYLKSNGLIYEDENGWFTDYPTYDELFTRFKNQHIFTDEEIKTAIDNTNVILDFEDIILDRSLKVPVMREYKKLPQSERDEIFRNILRKEWKLQQHDTNKDKFDNYITEIKHDMEEIVQCGMADYFIFNYYVMKLGQEKYGGRLTQSGRGSAVSMFINKLMRFTNVDKVNSPVLMYSERFLTKERIIDSHQPPDKLVTIIIFYISLHI